MDNPNYEQVQNEVILETKQPAPVAAALQHPLFLAICILISVGCGLNFLSGNINVLHILLTIFIWLAYANGRSGNPCSHHLRSISGTVFATYVINFIVFGGIALLGFVVAGAMVLVSANLDWIQESLDLIDPEIAVEVMELLEIFETYGQSVMFISALIVAGIFLLICIAGIVINILGFRKFHKFAQSLYLSVGAENPVFYKPGAVYGWSIAYGIFHGISALMALVDFQVFAFGSSAAFGAVFILGGIWIKKHFLSR